MMQQSINLKDRRLQIKDHHIWDKPDGIYIIELRAQKSKASNSMKAYLFSYVYPAICKEMSGLVNKQEIDYLHSALKERYGAVGLTDVVRQVSRKLIHAQELRPKSLTKYTVEEMQDYWLAITEMAATYFNLQIREPDPDWRKHYKVDESDAIIEKVMDEFGGELV